MIQECVEYCQWHDEYVDKIDLEEFLTLMKYGSPQRKWISDQVQEERAIASKLFWGIKHCRSEIKSIICSFFNPVSQRR